MRIPSLPFLCLFLLRGISCHNMRWHTRWDPKLTTKQMGKRTTEVIWRKRLGPSDPTGCYCASCWANDTNFTSIIIGTRLSYRVGADVMMGQSNLCIRGKSRQRLRDLEADSGFLTQPGDNGTESLVVSQVPSP